jgi:hypothetical protein
MMEAPMNVLDRTAWEVLNATADDCENLEQIYRQVAFEFLSLPDGEKSAYQPVAGAPSLKEIAEEIRTLVDAGLLVAVMNDEGSPLPDLNDPSFVWRAWFQMTPKGRAEWQSTNITEIDARRSLKTDSGSQ